MTSLFTVGSKVNATKGTLKQNVKILRAAKASKAAPKETPKGAKGMHGGNCRFKNVCAYDHQKPTINKDQKGINE